MKRRRLLTGYVAIALAIQGCATVPYVGQGPHPQIQRGMPFLPVDALGNVTGIIGKILLLDWRFDNHAISERTESYIVRFLDSHADRVGLTQVELNQYAPHHDLQRLFANHQVAWPYRVTLGLFTTLIVDVLLPGRVFPWGDYFNPWTNTVHVYSDHPAVALHELGHAWDFGGRRLKGTYAFVRAFPFVNLYQEYVASNEAFDYFIEIGDQEQETAAYKILIPAYGSYVGSYLLFPFNYVGIAVGHVWGRSAAAYQAHVYRTQDERQQHEDLAPPTPPSSNTPTGQEQPVVSPPAPEPPEPASADTLPRLLLRPPETC